MDDILMIPGDITEPLISINSCQICYESKEIEHLTCSHGFCIECLELYLKDKVLDGKVLIMKCPVTECLVPMNQEMIRRLLDDEWYEKYSFIREKKIKESNIYFRWCPERNCSGSDEFKGNNKLVCGVCKNEFCFLCSEKWHKGKCKNLFGVNGKEFTGWAREKNVKLCPQCRMPVEKNGGCENMNCTKCGLGFCWLCMQSTLVHNYDNCFRYSQGFNVYWFMCLALLFLPLSFLFAYFLALLFLFINIEFNGNENDPVIKSLQTNKYLLLIVSFILSPILIILSLALVPVLILLIAPISLSVSRNCSCLSYLIYQALAIILSPILISLFLIGLALILGIGPVIGLALCIYKLYFLIKVRRNDFVI